MFCHDCGAGLSPDSKFCKECGAKVGGNVKTMALTVQDLEPVSGDVNQERLTKLLDMAFWHNDAGNLDAAAKACEAALVINPSSTTAHSLLASIFEKKGDEDRAIAHLEAVLEINPESFADQVKLEQLRKGENVRAIQPPSGYRWIPPALAGLANAGPKLGLGALNERRVGGMRVMPLIYSGAAVLVVLAFGIAAIRAQDKPAITTSSDRTVPIASTRVATAPSAPQDPQYTPPFVDTPPPPPSTPPSTSSTSTSTATSKSTEKPDISSTPEVFGASDDPFARQIFDDAEARVGGRGSSATHRERADDGGTGAKPLPPLKAVPLTDTTAVAPAPVQLPAPVVTTENLPHHTVMVSPGDVQSAGDPANGVAAAPPPAQTASVSTNTGDNSGLVPVVRVTVHDSTPSTTSNDDTDVNRGDAPSNVPEVHNDAAQAYQDYALSLQQQGNYKAAIAQYERAIRSYKAEIRQGHDGDGVQRGLQACQTGLEICKQSQ